MKKRTLIILKPECLEHCLVGRALRYFDDVGYRIVASRVEKAPEWKMRAHYNEVIQRVGNKTGDDIVTRMTRGPCLFAIYEGRNAIDGTRTLVGATDPSKAAPGTIRGDMANSIEYNIIHASDSPESAKREIELWFPGHSYLSDEETIELQLSQMSVNDLNAAGATLGPGGTYLHTGC